MSTQSPQEYYAYLAYGLHPRRTEGCSQVVERKSSVQSEGSGPIAAFEGAYNGPPLPRSLRTVIAAADSEEPPDEYGVDVYGAAVALVSVDLRVVPSPAAATALRLTQKVEADVTFGVEAIPLPAGEEPTQDLLHEALPTDDVRSVLEALAADFQGALGEDFFVVVVDQEVVCAAGPNGWGAWSWGDPEGQQSSGPGGGEGENPGDETSLHGVAISIESRRARFRLWGLVQGSDVWRVLNGGREIVADVNWTERVVCAGLSRLYVEVLEIEAVEHAPSIFQPRVIWSVMPCL